MKGCFDLDDWTVQFDFDQWLQFNLIRWTEPSRRFGHRRPNWPRLVSGTCRARTRASFHPPNHCLSSDLTTTHVLNIRHRSSRPTRFNYQKKRPISSSWRCVHAPQSAHWDAHGYGGSGGGLWRCFDFILWYFYLDDWSSEILTFP